MVLICIALTSKSQVDTSTTQKLLQYIFQPLDKSQVPTGFMEEYGCPMLPMATFNGTLTDSNRMDMNLWRTLYFQLQTGWCRTTSNPLPTIASVNTTIKSNINDTLPIAIPLIVAQYNTVRTDAFTSNLLSYNSGTKQVSDVPGRPQNPYDTKNLFAACPQRKQTITGNETFVIKSGTIWNNTSKTISQVQIDFANGQGFQTVTIGTPIGVSYTDTGTKRWTLKVTLNDNSVLQCYSVFYVLKASSGSRYSNSDGTLWEVIAPVANVHSGAQVYIKYSQKSWTGTLRKPLIVVEGFDIHNKAPQVQESNYSIRSFVTGLEDANAGGWDFNSQLDDTAGYDLIFVDFNDGTDSIVRNAAVLQKVITDVNSSKQRDDRDNNNYQQNVVMGLSMGGLVARYALANMTKNFPGTPTDTRLLITHDSPHRGANIPLGLQYLIRMMGGFQLFGTNVYKIYPQYDEALGILDLPATKDMLLYRSLNATTYASNSFLDNGYRNMITFSPTGPQPSYRFVATANGNECANALFNPGKTFINLGAGVSAGLFARLLFFPVPIVTYKLGVQVEAYALPNTGSTNKIARLYAVNNLKLFGFIDVIKQLYDSTAYAPGTHLPVDGVPGSNYPMLDVQALSEITALPKIDPIHLNLVFPIGGVLGGYFGIYAYNSGVSTSFTFVSVGSALDVSPYNSNTFTQKYVNGVNQNYPSSSKNFIAQEHDGVNNIYNNEHIIFTTRNSKWIINEMKDLNPNNENCSVDCNPSLVISGADVFCTSSVYQIQNLSTGTVTWSSSPSGFVSITPSGNGYQATVTKLSSGNVTISATTNCGQVISKAIHVGGYSSSDYPISGPSTACKNSNVFFSAPSLPGATNYQWTWSANMTYVSGQGGNSLALRTGGVTGSNTITVKVANACDAGGSPAVKLLQVNCGSFFSASPNPTTGEVTVSMVGQGTTQENLAQLNSTSEKIYQIKVVDQGGTTKKQFSYSSGASSVKINLNGLITGIYTLQVYNGTEWSSQQIVKQ